MPERRVRACVIVFSVYCLYDFFFRVQNDPDARAQSPVATMREDWKWSSLSSFHVLSLGFLLLGLPFEALPPSAASRRRSLALSFSIRASPALRAIWERSSGLSLVNLAWPPSRPRARACGLGVRFTEINTS